MAFPCMAFTVLFLDLSMPRLYFTSSTAVTSYPSFANATEYLPAGVTVADQAQAKVTVTVHIAQLSTKVVNIFPSSIRVLNLPEGYKLSFDTSVIRVNVSGIAANLAALDTNSIVASIDAGQLTPGTHEVELALDLEENLYHEPVLVTVTVTEETPDEPTPDEPGIDEPGEEPTEDEEGVQ